MSRWSKNFFSNIVISTRSATGVLLLYDAVIAYFYVLVGVERMKRLWSFALFVIGTAFLYSSL